MNSGRNLRKSTTEKSRVSLETKGKRKNTASEDRTNSQSPPIQKRQKLDTTEEDLEQTSKVKAKRGRRPNLTRKPTEIGQSLVNSNRNEEHSAITSCNNTDQRLSCRENEKSPKVASNNNILNLSSNTENKSNIESESLRKFHRLKYNSLAKTPSPIVMADISGSNSPLLIDNEELLEFLSGLENIENKEPQSTDFSTVNDVPVIERFEKSPSRFFECPLCYKVFVDGNLARSHLANSCPKLS